MNTVIARALAGIALAATALSLPGAIPAAAAAPDVDVRPLPLPVGDSPTVPYLHRPTEASVSVVDPATGMKTPVALVGDELDTFTLLGRSGKGFVLRVTNRDIDRVVRAQLDVPQKTLANLHYSAKARLSADGRHLLHTSYPSTGGVRLVVRSASTAAVVAGHTFKATTRPEPVDASGTRVLLGGFNTPRTMVWDWKAGTIRTIASRSAYAGGFAANRLATYTKDPSIPDACSVVSTLTAPATRLWRGCREAVASFSPDGSRFATNAIEHQNHADVVRRRSLRGTLLTTYRNPNGLWMYAWESSSRILMRSHPSSGTPWLVRCEAAACERSWRAYS